MTDHLSTLQTKSFAALSANTDLGTKISGIYDVPPEDAAGTYMEIGDVSSNWRGTSSNDSWRARIEFHVWSDKKGKAAVHEILGLISAILHQANLDMTPFNLVNILEDDRDVITDVGDDLMHGIITFMAHIEA